MKEKFYITTAIAYTSKKPHIGNTYEIVMSDCIARYKRLCGFDVFLLTGSDEHGQKIQDCARESGLTSKEYVDNISDQIKSIWKTVNSSHDKFIRTTDADHIRIVQKIFKKLYNNGDIYKGQYSGLYCKPCESFWTDTQVIDNCCPDCNRIVIKTNEEAYFLKLSKYQDRLITYINEHPNFIQPESRKKEMINNFLKPGLQDLCVSRTSFNWGIPVDFDSNHVVYVWIDALSNYITALGYDPDLDIQMEKYSKYWPADLHVIGKDILRFHTIYWPIMLMALDIPLPKQVLGHPWLLSDNAKMSKSQGNVMYADDLINIFGLDPIRYYLLRNVPYANDGTISYEHIITTINSELVNTLGNLVNRVISMVIKYFDGVVFPVNKILQLDKDLINGCNNTFLQYKKLMDSYKISDALDILIELARRSNKYIDETMPWTLNKDELSKDRLKTVLYILMESIRFIAIMLYPVITDTSNNILSQLNTQKNTFDSIQEFSFNSFNLKVNNPQPIFQRIDLQEKLDEIFK